MELLTSTDLVLKRADHVILEAVNFTLRKGELIGLLGANGAGKSTLIKALAGLLPPAAGTIQLTGQPVQAFSPRQIARLLAYLPQGHEVHWSMTVENLVMLGRLPHLKPWQNPGATDKQIVSQALQDCDVDTFRQRRINTLSGGERARVLLARALAVQPRILLADEPLAGLDPGHQLDIMVYLKQLAQAGIGVVLVLHDLSLAMRYCHRIVLLGQQCVLQQGPPQTVMTPDNLARCFNIRAMTATLESIPFVLPIESLSSTQNP